MIKFLIRHKTTILFLFLIIIGSFFRFYNLNWGAPFYFHPDERNIAILLSTFSNFNLAYLTKGTFAYGNFPVVFLSIIKPLFSPFFNFFQMSDLFSQSIILLRIESALFSIGTLLAIFFIASFWGRKTGIIALSLAIFSPGLIQQAHFGTFDGLIAFWLLITFFFGMIFLKKRSLRFFYLALFSLSVGASIKINTLIFGLLIYSIFIFVFKKSFKKNWPLILQHFLLGIIITISLTLMFSPYYTTVDFRNLLTYERSIVTGSSDIFYTQSFYNTKPILFQFLNIYPFLINPLMVVTFVFSFIYLFFNALKNKNHLYFFLILSFLLIFASSSLLFTKWTRYMIPTLPFIYIMTAIGIISFMNFVKNKLAKEKKIIVEYLIICLFLLVGFTFAVSYFVTAYVNQDTRVSASLWAKETLPKNAKILSEAYDSGIIAFNPYFSDLKLFNFYEIDLDKNLEKEFLSQIKNYDYLILPSQRVLKSRILNPVKFPRGNNFYKNLSLGKLKFKMIYQTPCDIFCKITYLGNPVFGLEETANVFDRPTLFIFKKND